MTDGTVRRIIWRSSDVARVLGMGFLFLFLWKFFWLVHGALFVAMLAVLIAIVLHVPAKLLSRWIPFRLAFALVLVAFLGTLVGLLVAIIPQLVTQVTQLAGQLPGTVDSAAAWLDAKTGRQGPSSELSASIKRQAGQFIGRFVPVAFNALAALLGSFAVITLAAFLAAEPAVYRDQLLRIVPAEQRDRWTRLYAEAGGNLRAWVIGKACTMLFIGVVTYIGLTLLKVPGALALAAFAAMMEFIPNFGPTIAALPAMLAGFAVRPVTAIYVAVFYFLLQQVQNAITVPLVERRAVNIPPAALLVWQLMLALGFGIMALFVATPLLAVVVVAIRILYLEPTEDRQRWDRREPDQPLVAVDVAHPVAEPGEPPSDDG
jgi:predicted PurR-regulated permease PerM